MRTVIRLLAALVFVFVLAPSLANAQCSNPPDACVTGVSISPVPIRGDTVEPALGVAHVHNGSAGTVNLFFTTYITGPYAITLRCDGGLQINGQGCRYPGLGVGNYDLTFSYTAGNNSSTTYQGTIKVQVLYNNDPGMQAPFGVSPVTTPWEDPSQDPDPVCPDGSCGGAPINFSNGNTWITQHDYSIPGLGGGLALERTWNSLWSLMQPFEQSGIFGHSWRSTFEEHIQVQTGGTVKYWKGDGGSLFYAYSGSGGAYYMTAPADDQTTLSFDSSTTLWTATQKNGTRKIFNNAGYLISIIDRNGNTTTISVDAANQNRVASVTDAANRTLTFNYANPTFPRLCTSITDSVGTVATYSYDASGRLIQVLYPDGSQFNFSYDANNLILSVTDSQGKVVESHTYDSQRRGLTSQQANDSVGQPVNKITVSYGTSNPWNTTVTNSRGNNATVTMVNRAQRHYKSAAGGTVSCSTCGFLSGESSTISASGYKTSFTDPNQHTTFYTYDSQGNVASKSLPDQGRIDVWRYTYNSFGEVLTVTDPLGNVTTNQYDSNGNLLSTTTPSPDGGTTPGSTTGFTYDTTGQLLTITDPLSHTTTLDYYPTGLIHTITDAQNHTTTYVYDAHGNRTSVTDAAGNETQFQYDSMNRLTLITYPDSSTVQFGYDYRGRRTSVTDQNNKTTSYGYDGHGNVRFLANSAGAITDSYDFDAFGMPVRTSGTTPNQFLYSGERFDSSVGLYDLRARYYNHATGRFWARDPIWGNRDSGLSWNPYIYVRQNPVNMIDPTGKDAVEEIEIENASITFSNHGLAHLVEAGAGDSQAAVEAYIDALVRQFIAQVQASGGTVGNLFDLMFNSPLLGNVGWAARVFIVSAAEIRISTYFPINYP